MSSYKGHLVGGIAAYGFTLYGVTQWIHPSVPTMMEWLIFCLLGALFPDIDIKSKGQKIFYWGMLMGLCYAVAIGYYDAIALIGIFAIVPLCARHRGLFHRLWFITFLVAIIGWIASCLWSPHCSSIIFYDCLFFVAGAISHLWLDLGWRRLVRW